MYWSDWFEFINVNMPSDFLSFYWKQLGLSVINRSCTNGVCRELRKGRYDPRYNSVNIYIMYGNIKTLWNYLININKYYFIRCVKLMWFAIDNWQYVVECKSGRWGNVSEFVCISREDTNYLKDFILNQLKEYTLRELLIKL